MSGAIAKVGRPVALTDDVVRKLEAAIARGLSITEASTLAGIHRDTYYTHLAKNGQFAKRMERAKSWLNIAAKLVVYDSIVKDHNVSTAKWYLSHCDPDYGARVRCVYCRRELRTDHYSDEITKIKNKLAPVKPKTVSENITVPQVPILSVI